MADVGLDPQTAAFLASVSSGTIPVYSASDAHDVDLASADGGGAQKAMIPAGSGTSFLKAVAMVGAAIALLPEELLGTAIAAVATLTGWDRTDLLNGFLKKKSTRRRGRGITYRQLATARRVNRTIDRMYHSLHQHDPRRRPAASYTIQTKKRK